MTRNNSRRGPVHGPSRASPRLVSTRHSTRAITGHKSTRVTTTNEPQVRRRSTERDSESSNESPRNYAEPLRASDGLVPGQSTTRHARSAARNVVLWIPLPTPNAAAELTHPQPFVSAPRDAPSAFPTTAARKAVSPLLREPRSQRRDERIVHHGKLSLDWWRIEWCV